MLLKGLFLSVHPISEVILWVLFATFAHAVRFIRNHVLGASGLPGSDNGIRHGNHFSNTLCRVPHEIHVSV